MPLWNIGNLALMSVRQATVRVPAYIVTRVERQMKLLGRRTFPFAPSAGGMPWRTCSIPIGAIHVAFPAPPGTTTDLTSDNHSVHRVLVFIC
jgi:hypothetical protein